MKQLNEKVAIVTGAGQGIGKGIALCLAKRGVKVVCTGRREAPIQQTVAEIEELGGQGLAMTCDSADRARVEEVVKAAVDTFGSIDVIVNNGQAIVPSAPSRTPPTRTCSPPGSPAPSARSTTCRPPSRT